MTMPNPVAERLRAYANQTRLAVQAAPDDISAAMLANAELFEQAADLLERQQADIEAWRDTAKLFESQSAEIERLSRERDTGVPEGFWLAPIELTREMIRAVIPMYDAMIEGSEWPFTKNLYATLRAAAPQPPTVSTQGPSRAHFEILAEAMSEIKATSDGHSDQPIADIVAWCLSQIGALPAKSGLMSPDDWKTAIENARDPLPMEAEIWAAGADIETAHFVARMLRQQGYYLVNPDQLGWDDINRFNAELHKGQSVYEDAGGYIIRAIAALFGKKPDPVVSYRDAARELLKGAE